MTFQETVLSVLMGVIAFAGLLLASRAHEPTFGWIGFAMMGLGIAVIFVMIHRATGRPGRG